MTKEQPQTPGNVPHRQNHRLARSDAGSPAAWSPYHTHAEDERGHNALELLGEPQLMAVNLGLSQFL